MSRGIGYKLNVYKHRSYRNGGPVNIGSYGHGCGNKEPPLWMKDAVLPRCMPNGLSYREMVSFIDMHDAEAWQVMNVIAEKGGADATSPELWRSWIEQGEITTRFKQYLEEIQENYKRIAAEDQSGGKCCTWLADRVLPDSDYGLTYQELIDLIRHYDSEGESVVACICDSGLMDNGTIIYQNWILGERICLVFQHMLEKIIQSIEKLIENDGYGPPWEISCQTDVNV